MGPCQGAQQKGPQIMTRTQRFSAALVALMLLALPAWAIVIRGVPGSVHTLAVLQVDPDDIGKTCDVSATVVNGDSTHIGNELRIGGTPFQDVEGTANSTEVFETTLVLGETIVAEVRLNDTPELPPIPAYPEGRSIWSADVTLEYQCDTDTTTTSGPSTTTTLVVTTTTITVVTTTTEVPTTSSTSSSSTSTSSSSSTSSTVPATSSTTSPPSSVTPSVDCENNQIVIRGILEPGAWGIVQDGVTTADFVSDRTNQEEVRVFKFKPGTTSIGIVGPNYMTQIEVDCDWPTTSTVPPATGSTLPFTGANTIAALSLGIGWVLAGGLLLLYLARSRRALG